MLIGFNKIEITNKEYGKLSIEGECFMRWTAVDFSGFLFQDQED